MRVPMRTVDLPRVVVSLLRAIQVSLLSLDMPHCQRCSCFVQRIPCVSIQPHCTLITIYSQFELIILALYPGQQRAAISCTFEVTQQAKTYLSVTEGLRGDI